MTSYLNYLKHKSPNHVKHIHVQSTLWISLKLKSSRSGEKNPSLKREEPLAQAISSRLGETANREHLKVSLKLVHLAQASGLRLGEPSKQRGGELLLFSLRWELFA